jgi:RNA polymerase sigma-70 factor, ECF subfamily
MTDLFQTHRRRVFAVAYRMLGTRAEADDVVQDTWLRWREIDATQLQSAEAWLVTVVTRLSIDRLRAAKTEREAYPGPWLPEPLVDSPEDAAERAGEISVALMVVLERLAPEERAAFLLKQVFDRDYDEIAQALGKSEAACRQLVHRARERVQREQPRFTVNEATHRQHLERFIQAAQTGERAQLMALLADDVQLMGDGGGKATSVLTTLHGADRVARLFQVIARHRARITHRLARVNGELGVLRFRDGMLDSVLSVVTDEQGIVAIYTVRNPDKLRGLDGLSQTGV